MQEQAHTHYQIKSEYVNTGIIGIRIPKKYVTIKFNTNFEYTQEKLKRLYVYNEMRKYIEVEYKESTSITNEILESFDNVILITDVITKETKEKELLMDITLDNMTLSELRAKYPNIKSNSKASFIEKIKQQ